MQLSLELAVYCLLIGAALLHITIEFLNLRNLTPEIPAALRDEFAVYFSGDRYTKSQNYLKDSTRLSLVQTLVTTPALIWFIRSAGFHHINQFILGIGPRGFIVKGILFAGCVVILSSLLSLPFSIYKTFYIEQKYGFNKITWHLFLTDLIKASVLGAILGSLAFGGILWFFVHAGPSAWFWAWTAFTLFQIFLMFIAPVLIMPLFNRYTPLPPGELNDAIADYARSQNFSLHGIYTMDGSKRSTKANAFFTGFGRYRRVVLFDTLIEQHSVEELVAVLAHEIGHFKKKHVTRQLILSIGASFLMFFILSQFLTLPAVYEAFHVEGTPLYAGFIFFSFFYAPLSEVISLYGLYLSRKFEFEADDYAAQTFKRPVALITALKKLASQNLSNLTPHGLKVFTEYTHPPLAARIQNLRRFT